MKKKNVPNSFVVGRRDSWLLEAINILGTSYDRLGQIFSFILSLTPHLKS